MRLRSFAWPETNEIKVEGRLNKIQYPSSVIGITLMKLLSDDLGQPGVRLRIHQVFSPTQAGRPCGAPTSLRQKDCKAAQ